jgi:hypothetical protein
MVKRIYIFILIVPMILFGTSCSAKKTWMYKEENHSAQNAGKYKIDLAVKNNDVINNLGEIKNVEKLDDFFKSIGKGESKKIRVTIYTKKDEPVLYDLDTDGQIIHCRADNTRIEGSEKKVREYTFLNGAVKHRGDIDYYYLYNNDENDSKLVVFSKYN